MNNLDKQYQELLNYLLNSSTQKQTRNGNVISTFGYQIRHNMKDGFPLLTTKRMAWKQIVTELLWFLRGDTDIRFLWKNDCHIWDGDYEKSGKTDYNLGPIYGKQWRRWSIYPNKNGEYESNPIDQITELIKQLKTNPDSRRLMVSAWNVGELNQMVLPPCHYGFQVYTRGLSVKERLTYYPAHNAAPTRAISLMWNQRSVDTFLGLPFNIASYGLLLKIIAKAVNMVPDQLIGNLGDVHLYTNHIEQAKEQLTRTPYELPQLRINTEFWPTQSGECGIGPLTNNIDALINEMQIDDFQIENYQFHPTIKAPLSN